MKQLADELKMMGYGISPEQVELFEVYSREILDWNQRVNLTAITDHDEVRSKHFLDSLTLLQSFGHVTEPGELNVIDIGTGAGFPGIPLKIVLPEMKLTLLEATGKKTEFLRYVVSTLGLKNVEVITGRAEDTARIARHRESYNTVVSRAVAPLATLAELTLPFCTVGGRCVLPKKGDIAHEIEEATIAIETLGGKLIEVTPVTIGDLNDNRCLVIIEKMAPVPDKYPRRNGIPEKRPLR